MRYRLLASYFCLKMLICILIVCFKYKAKIKYSLKRFRVNDQSPDGSITGHDLLLTYKHYLNT